MKNKRRSRILWVYVGLMLALSGAACNPFAANPLPQAGQTRAPVPATGKVPSVTVADQEYDGKSVVVADVVSDGPGWIAIHNQVDNNIGPAIGFARVNDGDNKSVTVNVDPAQVTPTMYAMLHTDAGVVGKYEFPGPDVPVLLNAEMIAPPFKATTHAEAGGASSVKPLVVVKDQVVKDGRVSIAEVDSPSAGWVAIHVQGENGQPGVDIGFSAVNPGTNKDLVVTVDPKKVTPTMYAMLHRDAGEIGTYEFPGPDAPLEVNGQMIAPPFSTTGAQSNAAPTAGGAPTAQRATNTPAAAAATATAVSPTGAPSPTPTQAGGMVMATTSPSEAAPLVRVSDQPLVNDAVKVDEVVSNGPGWIVIYTLSADGQPDQPIGHAPVNNGSNRNVLVPVDPAKAQGALYAQLHTDGGQVGTFEFPGPDAPLMLGVQMIAGKFNVTRQQAAANPTPVPEVVPSITVDNQPIKGGTVVVREVVSDADAWLVIHRQNGDGTMGPMVGFSSVKSGVSKNVVVPVDTSLTSSTMYAMLHEDAGVKGKLEYPGPDGAILVNGQMVSPAFHITPGASGDVTINLSDSPNIVKHLVDSNGMSLYFSLNDTPGKSNCTGDCLSTWKPVLVTGRIIPGDGVPSNKLGVLLLPDGSRQVMYSGAPLYTYVSDTHPGDTNGQGLDGVWFVVTP